MQDLKIGIVQTEQFWEDKSRNLEHFGSLLREKFSDKEVDLILLPEMFNTGFTMHADKFAESMDGPSVQFLINLATELQTQIAATMIIKENDSYYNRLLVVSKDGVLTYYNKRHLFRMAGEHHNFTPGQDRVVYPLKGWKLMLQICYDLRFPVFVRNKFVDGAKEYDALIYLANWPERRVYAWRNLLQARAIENQVYCIGVNRIGQDGNNNTYSGDSMIIDPWGEIEQDFPKNEEVVKVFTLSKNKLEDIFDKFPTYLDAD